MRKTLRKKAWILSAISFIVAIAISSLLSAIIPFLGINENEYLTQFYDIRNKQNQPILDDTTTIIVTTDSMDRAYLAHLIDKLCESEASVVAVDLLFRGNKDSKSDSLLVEVLNRHAQKLVMATAEGENGSMKSFFENDCSPELTFGLTNLPDYFYAATKSDWDRPLLSEATVRKIRPDLNSERIVINFLNCDFQTISEEQFLSEPDGIELNGKIILLGGIDDDDNHKAPFLIEGKHWIKGIKIHAYAVHSLIEEKDAFHKFPWYGDISLCALLTVLFSLLYVRYVYWIHAVKNSISEKWGKLIFLTKPFAVLLAEILCYLLCYCILTSLFQITPNVLLYMISILLISGFSDAIDEFITE